MRPQQQYDDDDYLSVDRGALRGMMAFLFGLGFLVGAVVSVLLTLAIT